MRIAMVTDYYLPTLGGVQTAIKAHREELLGAGHDVVVFAPLAEPSPGPGVVRLPTARGFAPDGYPFTWPLRDATAQLEHDLSGFDVVHVHTEMFAALAAYRAAGSLRIPLVQTMHGRIDVYTRSVLPLPGITTALLAGLHRRGLGPAPGTRPLDLDASAPYARTRTARRMWRLMVSQAQRADRVIVPSAHFAAKLVRQGVQTPLDVLSNGLEATVLDTIGTPAERRPEPGEDLRVLWCGRLSPEKRPQVFLDAVSRTPGIEAVMLGDGISRRAVARAASRIGSGRVDVRGSVPQTEVLAAMRTAHVLVSSSFDFDNQPMVLLEAVAAGLPVIVADPDLSEALPRDGHLVAPRPDAAGLAEALAALRDDPAQVADMSAAAIAHRPRVAQSAHREGLLRAYRAAVTARASR
ncbi:glycosyltransferase [Microbacterium sp. Au-Mic1]|uniref:glycosyltransferase n=1 Tax=Microbacterium sp. Au-Mic1 TaxID=2906457 RepID=UPI001E541550|nr:glycosyltransferase [Microbacterium sp. Au-Mic1]MCE4025163.1 glycosyltransferase [Microbacterium sp. Au-Mic1]